MVDGIEHIEQFHCSIPLAQECAGFHDPGRGVSVLASVFTDAGHVTLDVTRVLRRVHKGRREKTDEAILLADQLRFRRVHGLGGAIRWRRAGNDGRAREHVADLLGIGLEIRYVSRFIEKRREMTDGSEASTLRVDASLN